MIIDSHAHYSHNSFAAEFPYLTHSKTGFALDRGDLPQLLQQMQQADIPYSIEPAISLDSCQRVLQLCREHPGRIFPVVGVHPTRCIHEQWRDRRKLRPYAAEEGIVAIGETGLDYHHPRKEQHRFLQHIWFLYQLDLAWRKKLPVVLHVRDAHEDALRILRLHPARKLGGVVHCFNFRGDVAQQYLRLGYHIGIGGSILQTEDRAKDLWEAIPGIPLDRILVETDAPFILPYCKDVLPAKALRRARNTSLILPAVIEKIAQLKGISPEEVERATTQNTIRLFRLPIA